MRAAFAVLIAALLSLPALSQVNWSGGVAYEYDGSGNVRKIGTDTYVYDTAQRLIRGSVAGSQQSYTYDSFGNRKSCQPGGGGDCQYGYQVDSATNRVQGRTYDKRGNMLQLPEGNTLEYDELGMVRQENGSGRKVYYIYTADDERVAVYEADTQLAKDAWQWTVRGLDKKPLREFTSEGVSGTTNFKWAKDHVWREGALLASRQAEAGAPGGVSTYHYHVDHLGTPRQVTNASSVIVGRHDYLPFGPEVTGTRTDEPKLQDLKFTGHERDEARDRPPLDYMHARYYEPRLGRFLSVDPVPGDPQRPQTWNRYAYVLNNPTNATDPDGRQPQKDRIELMAEQLIPDLPTAENPLVLDPKDRPLETWANVAMIATLVTPFVGDESIGKAAATTARTVAAEGSVSRAAGAGETTALVKRPTTALVHYYPPNGGAIGTAERQFVMPGQMMDRYGGSGASRYFSPAGTPPGARSLPPGTVNRGLQTYEVMRPFEVRVSTVAPWFGQLGGGTQYVTPVRLDVLIRRAIIKAK